MKKLRDMNEWEAGSIEVSNHPGALDEVVLEIHPSSASVPQGTLFIVLSREEARALAKSLDGACDWVLPEKI
jgi:hypothetical protein